MSTNDDILDSITTHSVALERYKAGERRNVLQVLRELERELIRQLASVDPTAPVRTAFQQARLQALLKQTRDTIATQYRSLGAAVSRDLLGVAQVEHAFAVSAINGALMVDLVSVGVSDEVLKRIASRTMIDGAASRDWWKEQGDILARKFTRTMQQGMARGETLGELTKRIRGTRAAGYSDGIMEASRRQAEALVRTSVQTVANEARDATYQQHDDLIKAVQWVSTLDGRTTIECATRDGKLYTLDHQPIGHSIPWNEGPGRLHWNCRSTSVPVLKSWAELARPGAVRTGGRPADVEAIFQRKLQEMGMDPAQRAAAVRNARASMDGQVPAARTYEQFLQGKGEAFQNRVLGQGKAQLWRDGKIGFSDLVNQDGRPLTLAQLQADT